MRLFPAEKRVDRKVSVSKWWAENSVEKPLLFEIDKIAYDVPPTQVSVERVYSSAKFIMNPQRTRLNSEPNKESIGHILGRYLSVRYTRIFSVTTKRANRCFYLIWVVCMSQPSLSLLCAVPFFL